jgi:hypothetical protein
VFGLPGVFIRSNGRRKAEATGDVSRVSLLSQEDIDVRPGGLSQFEERPPRTGRLIQRGAPGCAPSDICKSAANRISTI